PLHKRALVIREKALGPNHPHVSQSLDNYADLLRKMNRESEAGQMEARAKAIRAKHARENPTK
ncbi:MAG: tetratricopeptide repeat protein, partial [Dehalococcoidales bacterium]